MSIDFIKNEIILSMCAGSITGNLHHLGGLPGAGKTATITSLIEELSDANLITKGSVLLCSKTNAAKSNMFSSCAMPGGYVLESKFVTVNSGFAIPVIKNSADTENEMIKDYINNLKRKFISNICLSDMIVMDEYTMTNINEILFIDCLLRAAKGRSNVPFGGTPIIFLGDNRQNSAVINRKNSSTRGGATSPKTGGIDLISEVLLKILVDFLQCTDFITLFTRGCQMRKHSLVDRHSYVKSVNNDTQSSPGPCSSSDENECDNFMDDLLDEAILAEMLEVEQPLTSFAGRIDRITDGKEGRDIAKVAKITGYDVLREEALRVEVTHVDKFLTFNEEKTEKMIKDIVEEIVHFATLAMREIVNTGRERFYLLSGMTDVLQDCHALSLVNEEIINIKLHIGNDPQCLGSLEILSRISEDERAERGSNAIMNAFFRSGDEPKGFEALAEVFKHNLEEFMEELSRENLTAHDLLELANAAAKREVAPKYSEQRNNDDDKDDDNDYYYDDDYEEEEEEEGIITSRNDTPREIEINDPTCERVKKTVSFVPKYYKFYRLFSPLTRVRFWYVYLLARDVQTASLFASPVTSPFSKKSAGGKDTTIEFQDPYWLRALSLPINSSLDTSDMQSAYAASLSIMSRTFIMSSQKRISVAHHSLGLMYSMSLFEMTVDARALVDFRDLTSSIPIGFVHNFSPLEYLQTIFPSIVSEFLVITKSDISNEIKDVKNSGGSDLGLDLDIVNQTVKNMGINPSRQSKIANCVFIASSILASTAKVNIHANMLKKKDEQTTLLDKLLSEAEDNSGPVGALALTKGHIQKNIITDLVEKTIATAAQKNSQGSYNELPSVRFETKFLVAGLDLSDIGHNRSITPQQKEIIISKCMGARAVKPGVFIDRLTDIKLLHSTSTRDFMGHLMRLRDNVTRSQESIFFVGQSVTFTHSNRITNSPYSCNVMFYTTDTGFIKKIEAKGNRSVIHIVLDKSGEVAQVSPGHECFGPIINGHHGASVYYFPLSSNKAQTIYSSQGQTFWRDVIVDITDASSQDMYVAVTRNADILNLKIMRSSQKEMSSLLSMKTTMGRDKTKLFSLGGLRGVNASDTVGTKLKNTESTGMQTAVLDKTRDLVAAAQKFVMNLTNNNSFGFNSSWMENTGKLLNKDGLESRLQEIEHFFFSPDTPRHIIEYYNNQTNKTLMQLFVCVQRSVLHYCMTSKCIKTPSMAALKMYRDNPNNVKFHPAFVNSPLKPQTIETLFYDIAPHSFVTKVFQFYVHFLFLVYEQSHICLSSFAFLPSASPTYNASTRVKMDDKTLENVRENMLFVPGKEALAHESPEFTNSKDGCIRTRKKIVQEDFKTDKLLERASSDFVADKPVEAIAVMDALGKAQKYNLRRTGKYCRKGEAVGLNSHGAVAIACDCEELSKSNLHFKDEWASFSYETNLYGMLTLMTKLAAASGVTKKACNDILPSVVFVHGYSVKPSPEILYCGQCDPMFRIQFLLHCTKRAGKGDGSAEENLFGPEFENKLGRKINNSVKVVIMTETYGGISFTNTTVSEVRNSIFMGLGKTRVEEKATLAEANALINKFLKLKKFQRISFFLSVSVS